MHPRRAGSITSLTGFVERSGLHAAMAVLEFLAGAARARGVARGPGPGWARARWARAAPVGAVAGAGPALSARRQPHRPAGRAGGALFDHRLLGLAAGHRIDRLRLDPQF